MRTISILTSVLLASSSLFVFAGCSQDAEGPQPSAASPTGDDSAESSEDALTERDVKVLAKDRRYPGDLVFADGKIYWSEASQVASGDPELDQQFAYWTGSIYSFNVSRSQSPKKLADIPSPVRKVTTVGDDIYITQAGFVSKTNAAGLDNHTEWKAIYQDVDHFEINEEDEVASSAVDGGRVYVLRTTGEVVSVKTDGTGFKSHVKSGSYASNLFVSGGTALWVTASDQPYERAIYKASVSAANAQAKEVMKVRNDISGFVQDGNDVYFGTQAKPGQAGSGAIMKLSLTGNGAPQTVVSGLESVSTIALDGDKLLFTGRKGTIEGLFSVVKADLGPAAKTKTIYKLKAASDILPTADAIFLTSTALDRSNRYSGSVVRLEKAGIR